jgi:hypothetical protein
MLITSARMPCKHEPFSKAVLVNSGTHEPEDLKDQPRQTAKKRFLNTAILTGYAAQL